MKRTCSRGWQKRKVDGIEDAQIYHSLIMSLEVEGLDVFSTKDWGRNTSKNGGLESSGRE